MKALILIIEDEEDIAKTLRIALEAEGYDVAMAPDGEEGLQKAKKYHPDLIVLDLKLPKLPGEVVCKEIRNDELIARIPIIMLTAKDSEIDRVVGKVIGANCYMTKPYELDELSVNIRNLLGGQKP